MIQQEFKALLGNKKSKPLTRIGQKTSMIFGKRGVQQWKFLLISNQYAKEKPSIKSDAHARKASSVTGRMARVSAVRMGLVMNMKTRPQAATTTERSAMLMLWVPALFISRVSCVIA